jgi:hypothetical protein
MKLLGNPIRSFKAFLAIGFTLAISATPLFAQTSSTLANLVNGGYLAIDDKIFTNFSYQASGLTSFNPSLINVTASQIGNVDYLTWSGSILLSSSGISSADLILQYAVFANPGPIIMIDQYYSGIVTNGFLAVDETAATGAFGGTVVGFSHLEATDLADPPAEPLQGDSLNINPGQSVLYITKDIGMATISPNGGVVYLSQVIQSFHQVPEPSTIALGCLGGGLMLILGSRRRNRRG